MHIEKLLTEISSNKPHHATRKQMFLLVPAAICAPERDTNMASPYKGLEIWEKRFSEYLAYEIFALTWFLARLFVYLFSFISKILDFRF